MTAINKKRVAGLISGRGSNMEALLAAAQDPDNPQYGNIQLVFTANPVELRQWVITDDSGSQTTVILGDLKKGGNLRASLFSIPAEADKRMR